MVPPLVPSRYIRLTEFVGYDGGDSPPPSLLMFSDLFSDGSTIPRLDLSDLPPLVLRPPAAK